MRNNSLLLRLLAVALVTIIALGLHQRAVRLLPIDYDEDDYLGAAQRYAAFLADRDLRGLIDYDFNYEHPPLTKLAYGLAILPLPKAPLLPEQSPNIPPAKSLPQPHFRIARTLSAAFGTLEVLALAAFNPLAGLFLAIHTWQTKYTSQIMLEPLPALASLLAVLFYTLSQPRGNQRGTWLWLLLSAVALGLTAASKYTYCVVGLAIAADMGWRMANHSGQSTSSLSDRPFRRLLLWGTVAIAVFFVADPRLWSHPFQRLAQSLLYHGAYAQSAHVREANFPFWQPLVWLLGSVPWHPGVFLLPLDLPITIFAALGWRPFWQKHRVFALWLLIGLIFLLLWPTKWPQYILTITAPLCLAAAEGFRATVWAPLARKWRQNRGQTQSAPVSAAERARPRDLKRALPWLAPGALVLFILALYPFIYQSAMSLTDFNAISIRDGINGGVWRAAWYGLTGQEKAAPLSIFGRGSQSKTVHYAGPALLGQLLLGAAPDVLAFNLLWMILSVALQAALGIAAALALNQRGLRLRSLWRTLFILPWAIPEFVGALVWLRIFEPRYGWLALAQHIPADVNLSNWFENPTTTLLILLIAATWYGFPFIMLAATAALKLVPDEVYDAAAIDGATGWNRFRSITWPLLLPLVAPALIIRAIFAFNQFYLFYSMRVEPPTITFATASYYFFAPSGYFGGQFAVSAAINIFTVLVLIGLALWFNKWSKVAEGVTYV